MVAPVPEARGVRPASASEHHPPYQLHRDVALPRRCRFAGTADKQNRARKSQESNSPSPAQTAFRVCDVAFVNRNWSQPKGRSGSG